jgi:ferric-dicitrate binding protein FerR (iron transport regulator)
MIQRWDDLTPEEQARYTDAEQLRAQLAAATQRAEAAEAALAAVPRRAIDALFRQQFGSYPIWFNETWTPIADWLGYKPARR